MKKTQNTTVYLSNLAYSRDRNGIRSLAGPYGKIRDIKIIVDPETNKSKGMAFVEMERFEDAERMIKELNGTVLDRRNLKANWAIPQEKKIVPDSDKKKNAKTNKGLNYKEIQLAKKARNDAKRKSNPFYN